MICCFNIYIQMFKGYRKPLAWLIKVLRSFLHTSHITCMSEAKNQGEMKERDSEHEKEREKSGLRLHLSNSPDRKHLSKVKVCCQSSAFIR